MSHSNIIFIFKKPHLAIIKHRALQINTHEPSDPSGGLGSP